MRRLAWTWSLMLLGSMLLGSMLCTRVAVAQDDSIKEQCADAYERVQRARLVGSLRAARDAARFCAQDACPTVLRDDCLTWTRELDRLVPSVVFDVRDGDGEPVLAGELRVDGVVVPGALSGRAVELVVEANGC